MANSATFCVGLATMSMATTLARNRAMSYAYLVGRAPTVLIQFVRLDASKEIVRGQVSATAVQAGKVHLVSSASGIQVACMALAANRTSATVKKVGAGSYVTKVSFYCLVHLI